MGGARNARLSSEFWVQRGVRGTVWIFPRTTRGERPYHGAMACGPVDADSCFCEADAMLGGLTTHTP
jgi:hypothetical protein